MIERAHLFALPEALLSVPVAHLRPGDPLIDVGCIHPGLDRGTASASCNGPWAKSLHYLPPLYMWNAWTVPWWSGS